MTAAKTDVASYVRGKLFMAGVDGSTSIGTALDCMTVIMMDVPTETIEKWRTEFDSALGRVRPAEPEPGLDRDTWGALPEHQAQMTWMQES